MRLAVTIEQVLHFLFERMSFPYNLFPYFPLFIENTVRSENLVDHLLDDKRPNVLKVAFTL